MWIPTTVLVFFPSGYRVSGRRFFFVDSSGTITFNLLYPTQGFAVFSAKQSEMVYGSTHKYECHFGKEC